MSKSWNRSRSWHVNVEIEYLRRAMYHIECNVEPPMHAFCYKHQDFSDRCKVCIEAEEEWSNYFYQQERYDVLYAEWLDRNGYGLWASED